MTKTTTALLVALGTTTSAFADPLPAPSTYTPGQVEPAPVTAPLYQPAAPLPAPVDLQAQIDTDRS